MGYKVDLRRPWSVRDEQPPVAMYRLWLGEQWPASMVGARLTLEDKATGRRVVGTITGVGVDGRTADVEVRDDEDR